MKLVGSTAAPRGRWVIAWAAGLAGLIAAAGAANAVPVLQVGAPGGPGEGIYADYVDGTDPAEDETAFTSGGTIYVAGLYQNGNVRNLGGQFGSGGNWSSFGLPAVFDLHDAVLLISVPDGTLATALASLTVDGAFAFFSSEDESFFPNNHAPVQDDVADFLFFDIGEFAELVEVPEFDSEIAGSQLGEIKELLLAGFGSLNWLHVDVMALETSDQGQTAFRTSLEGNPGSHDATLIPDIEIPEPASLALLGAGLSGLGVLLLRRRARSS